MVDASLSSRLCRTRGSLKAICLISAKLLDPPPSIMYEARVHGAPANPISGTAS